MEGEASSGSRARESCQTVNEAQKEASDGEGWRTVNGARLRYVYYGSGPHALLCIPGALGTAELHYQPQLEHFGREGSGFKVVSFDPRGYGKSQGVERPKEDSFSVDARDGYELMKSLSLPIFSVLGWCNGGTAGLILASLFPQAVRKLVVFGTRSYITSQEVGRFEDTRDIDKSDNAIIVPHVEIYGYEGLKRLWWEWLETVNACYTENGGDICTKTLSQVTCPTLVVHGRRDDMTPVFHAEYLREHVRGCRLVVMEQGRHMIHMKHQVEFNSLVENFLNEPI